MIDIVLPNTPTYDPRTFEPAYRFLLGGLTDLGLSPRLRAWDGAFPRPAIVLAPHLLTTEQIAETPPHTVLYNFEQLGDSGTRMIADELWQACATRPMWDYSRRNVAYWAKLGTDATYVPVGHHRFMDTGIVPAAEPEVDVLLFGSLNDRRRAALIAMEERGLRVGYGVGFGDDLNSLIARARMIVNIHYYEAGIMEIVRLSHLWASRVPVLTELRPGDETPFAMEEVCLHATLEAFPDAAVAALADPRALRRHADDLEREFARRAPAAVLLARALREAERRSA